jgi:hypothetical protein
MIEIDLAMVTVAVHPDVCPSATFFRPRRYLSAYFGGRPVSHGIEQGDNAACREIEVLHLLARFVNDTCACLKPIMSILSSLVQYWTAIYSDPAEDADTPFVAASGVWKWRSIATHRKRASRDTNFEKGKYEK